MPAMGACSTLYTISSEAFGEICMRTKFILGRRRLSILSRELASPLSRFLFLLLQHAILCISLVTSPFNDHQMLSG